MEIPHTNRLKWLSIAKSAILGAMLSAASFPAMAESHLIVYFTDGTATSFVVSDKPHVSFGDNEILIRANDVTSEFQLAAVCKFAFADQSGIVSPELIENEVRFTYTDRNHLGAMGLTPGENVAIYRTDGSRALTAKASADGSAEIDLGNLEPGIYIVNTASKTFKIKH